MHRQQVGRRSGGEGYWAGIGRGDWKRVGVSGRWCTGVTGSDRKGWVEGCVGVTGNE